MPLLVGSNSEESGYSSVLGRETPTVENYRKALQRLYSDKADEVYGRMLKKPAPERLKLLRESEGAQGRFLWAILRDSFHYAAVHLADIAESARDVDFAMRWGFGVQQGPFELWQAAGWEQVAGWIAADVAAGKAMSKAPLPAWVTDGRKGVHGPEGSWSAETGRSR